MRQTSYLCLGIAAALAVFAMSDPSGAILVRTAVILAVFLVAAIVFAILSIGEPARSRGRDAAPVEPVER